jgi:hypothetical protein
MSSLVPPFLWRSPFKLKSDLEVERQWIQHDSTIFSELLVSGPIPVILSTLAWMIHLPRTHGFELRGATWTDTGKFVFCAHFLVGWG